MDRWLLPTAATEKQLFVCDRFPQGKFASGKFPWTRQKEPKNYPKVKVIKTQSEQLGKLITFSFTDQDI